MKIGVISDTHIPINAKQLPQSVFKHFKDVDMILHAGDLVDLSVLDELRAITPNVEAVSGNMDSPENRTALRQKKIFMIDGVKIGITHGWGPPDDIRQRIAEVFKDEKPDVIIFGHTHQPEKTIENGILFLNPGSSTDKRFAKTNAVAILTITNGKADAEIIEL